MIGLDSGPTKLRFETSLHFKLGQRLLMLKLKARKMPEKELSFKDIYGARRRVGGQLVMVTNWPP